MYRSVINSVGSYLPERVMDNYELEHIVETNHDWIVERTGIHKRHIARDDQATSDLATEAAKNALESSKLSADDIDLVIVATTTPDHTFPSTATKVQANLGIKKGAAFDVQAVCSGFVYALATADSYIKTGLATNALVIGADTLSRIVDWSDRGTCILFADGAGAVTLSKQEVKDGEKKGILQTALYSDGSHHDLLYTNGGVSSNQQTGHIVMHGREVFKHAVQLMSDVTTEVIEKEGLSINDVDWFVPHQANVRIMDAIAKRLDISKDKVIATIQNHANTSAATIPLALDVAVKDGRIQPGNLVALQALGGGLTWGGVLLHW